MEVQIVDSTGKFMVNPMVTPNLTVDDLKRLVHKKIPSLYPKRQSYYIRRSLKSDYIYLEDSRSLASYGIEGGDVLYFHDVGGQINTKLANVLENAGPLLIFSLFCLYPEFIWDEPKENLDNIQKTCLVLGLFHFARRILECAFVHIYSNPTIPMVEFLTMAAQYWGIFGCLVGYCLFAPAYDSPQFSTFKRWLYVVCYLFTEVMNCGCHFVLRGLRRPRETQRSIPWGFGFSWVSGANHFWEGIGIVFYSLLVDNFAGYAYMGMSVVMISMVCHKKHEDYLREFDGKEGRQMYPRDRKAIIPFLF